MRFILSNELNKKKWDDLVQNSNYYSYSYFLDALAKNWGVFVDENYTKGAAVCFNKIMGYKILYPVLLGRTIECINFSEQEREDLFYKIKKDFKIGTLNLEFEITSSASPSRKVYQVYNSKAKPNTLSKRMLKKCDEYNLTSKETDYKAILNIIHTELSQKVKELNDENQKRLTTFINAIDFEKKLIALGVFNANKELDGGLLFFEGADKITYITGACKNESRSRGGMYLAMNKIIEFAAKKKKKLDFGGSNIESIRRFYLSIGGEDKEYYSYNWNNAPLWFNILRSIKKRI